MSSTLLQIYSPQKPHLTNESIPKPKGYLSHKHTKLRVLRDDSDPRLFRRENNSLLTVLPFNHFILKTIDGKNGLFKCVL